METWPDKALKIELHVFDFLDHFFREHAFYSLIGIMVLLILFLVYFLIVTSRHHEGHEVGESGIRSGIIFHFKQNPPQQSDTFNPFPPSGGHDDDFND